MSSPRQRPAAPTEEELLQQWAFLDSLVERQAAQLRAGVQDVEEPDELEGAPERAELEGLRTSLAVAEAERDDLRSRVAAAERQLALARARAEAATQERVAERVRSQEAIGALQRRLQATESAQARTEAALAQTRAALEHAERDLQVLRDRAGQPRRGFWRVGRRPPSG